MVNAKHCCWGTCPSDSRYSEKLPKQGIEKSDGNVCSSNVLIVIDRTVLVFIARNEVHAPALYSGFLHESWIPRAFYPAAFLVVI